MKGSFFRTLLTEDDANQVWCPMRIAFWVAFALFVVLCLYAYVVKGQSFDPVAFSTGAPVRRRRSRSEVRICCD